jgi:5-methylcytosine-specific restriction endonuclease McrA
MSWESLEKTKFMYNRQIYMNPQAKHFLGSSFEDCEHNIQKIKDVQLLPKIVQLLKGYYNLIPHPGDKEYLDERISTYEKEIETNAKPKKSKQAKEKPKESKKKVSATLKRLVWNTSIGEEIGKTKCLCCKSTDITQMSFHCGHVIAEVNGGELIVSNLKPICQNCNSSMGTKNMNEFMESFQ